MKRTLSRLLVRSVPLVMALGLCGAAVAAPVGSRGAHCGPASARTLASSQEARVYTVHKAVYGCAGSRQFRLDRPHSPVGVVVVVGKLAAFARYFEGYDFTSASVIVENLTDGKRLWDGEAFPRDPQGEYDQRVGSLVARPDGHVAWIVSSTMLGADKIVRVFRGRDVLDSGRAIRTHSLRLHGTRLSWKHGSRTKTAQLR